MGLDVYVYRCADRPKVKAIEEQYNERTEALWEGLGSYESISEEKKDAIRAQSKAIAVELGVGEWGEHPAAQKVEINSTLYPDHLFKIGYFRSSYNGSGINHVLGNMGLPTLHEIMDAGDEYEFVPDWQGSLRRITEAIDRYKARLEQTDGCRVFHVEHNSFGAAPEAPTNETEALDLFTKELERKKKNGVSFDGDYSNIFGHWSMGDPTQVVALLPGYDSFLGKRQACVYVVFKPRNPSGDYILQSLEIVRETIEYVLSSDKPEEFYVHWSS